LSTPQRAVFIDRERCIACGGSAFDMLSEGRYADEPLRGILASQPWGEHPLPFVEHERWRYVRCRDCGQRFHQRILDPTWMQRLYARWESQEAMTAFMEATSTAEQRAQRGVHFIAHALRLQRLLAARPAPRVLDFGCGHGEFVAVCRTLGLEAHGIDWASDRREHGLVHIHPSLQALRADGAHGNGFDAVVMFEVLEHLADPRGALEQVAALMTPGATLVLETPNTSAVTDLRSFADYLAIAPLGHINGFTPATLRAIAERAGFRATRAPPAWVAGTWRAAARQGARNLLARWRRPSTQQYFELSAAPRPAGSPR
jgi:2-polyprenyl-3-methyl-5-hydroxy-6-metoxy-1,4-benzoquinol methylase